MRYAYVKRKNGSYDPILKWERPYNGKTELLSIMGACLLVAVITYWAFIILTNSL